MTDYYLGTTVKVTLTMTDFDGTDLNPDSFSVVVLDPDGNAHSSSPFTSLTKVTDGEYYFWLTFPSDGVAGNWLIIPTVTKASRDSVVASTIALKSPSAS